ncbi:NTE family protein [Amycolatopsis xylanica]|uniref:NTE family protein n=1 Tax=Amycolatopsis xylanica TaxID=589385 RepID=A0A1H2TG62_9PSEU|nr:patatin-like phospholipase family protein [Amycolatopsis xylanica]SDW42810.1 NTE family protein [Amycolatopsis xylanica]
MTRHSDSALVIGCGGTLGFAWTAAVLDALHTRAGWDPGAARFLIGTSAGAEAVAMLGAGIPASAILGALTGSDGDPVVSAHLRRSPGRFPPVPSPRWPATGLVRAARRGQVDRTAGLAGLLPLGRGDAGWLRDLGDALATENGWVAHPATWCVATDLTGQRVAFGSPEAPSANLGEAIAASWAIPGWFPPVPIGGRLFLDGGTVSPTSADLLLGHDVEEVVVIAPMSSESGALARGFSRAERLLRAAMTRRLDDEVRRLRAAGSRVIRIEPSQRDLDAMGANFMDGRRRERVLDTAMSTAPDLLDQAFEGQGARS